MSYYLTLTIFYVLQLLDEEVYLSELQQYFHRIEAILKDFVLNDLVRGLHYLNWHTLDRPTSLIEFDSDCLIRSVYAVCKSNSIFESGRDLSQHSFPMNPSLNSRQNINSRKGSIDSNLSHSASALNHDIFAE